MTQKKVSLTFSAGLVVMGLVTSSNGLFTRAEAAPVEPVKLAASLEVRSTKQAGIKDLLEKGMYKQALEQWEGAYGQSGFYRSATGQALFDLLLFRNNLQPLALEKLFSLKNPSKISPEVRHAWAEEVPSDHQVWREIDVRWSPKWESVFPAAVGDTVAAWRAPIPTSPKSFSNDENLLRKLNMENAARARLLWQLGLGSAVAGRGGQAQTYFRELLNSDQSVVPQDQIALAQARVYYQDGDLDKAMDSYDKVPKDSDYWLEAVEEKAWSDVRKKDYDGALSRMKTLTVPFFANQLGPEPYYLWGLSAIRICDYASVFKMLKTFKERFKERVSDLQKVATTGSTPAVIKAMGQLEADGGVQGMGDDLGLLPRLYQKDDGLSRLSTQARLARDEVQSLTNMLTEAPGNPELEALKFQSQKDYQGAHFRSVEKMKTLASRDVAELKGILTKLHVVEVEAIQRMFPHRSLSKNEAPGKKSLESPTDKQIQFPQDGEVWLDELSHYQVNTKGCPARGG